MTGIGACYSQSTGLRLSASLVIILLMLACCDLPGVSRRQVTIMDGEVTVRAPDFYCVDRESSRSGDDTAVVLIGRCAAKGRAAAALVTVTVGQSASGGVMASGPEPLRQFLVTPAGRKAMARSGRAEDLEVLQSDVVDDVLFAQVNDALAGEYWRAVISLKGRLVTVSALGPEGVPLGPEEGRHLVEETVAALIEANPAVRHQQEGGFTDPARPV